MDKVLFPEVSKSIWVSILFSLAFLLVLYYLSEGRTSEANPMMVYLVGFLLLVVIGINSTKFSDFKRVFGFKTPYPGYNIFLGLLGVGLGFLVYGLFTRPMMVLFAGDSQAMSLIQPFYLPLRSTSFALVTALPPFGAIILYSIVGFFEEAYKIVIFKNMSNWFYGRFKNHLLALSLGFFSSLLFWGVHHYFSWGGLTFVSVIAAVAYGMIFWSAYFIPDVMGILSPEKPLEFTGVLLMGAISSHTVWDILVTMEEPFMSPDLLAVTGFLLVVVSLVLMWVVRVYYSGSVSVEVSPSAG